MLIKPVKKIIIGTLKYHGSFGERWFYKLFGLLLLLAPSLILGQAPNLKFKQISTEQGLSNGFVCSVFQDSRGFMWFGTMEGLNRYDGDHIKTFYHNDKGPLSLSSSFVHKIYEDRRHNLWIGTQNGLNRFNPYKNTFTRFLPIAGSRNSISGNTISNIYEDHQKICG
jgi:ligand-binding sensor domain-containing protein